jgi:hypothetical protein
MSLFGQKQVKTLSDLKDKKAEEITSQECEAATQELNEAGIHVVVATQPIIDAAIDAAVNVASTDLKSQITTLTQERDDYKAKYEATPLANSSNAGADKEGDDDENKEYDWTKSNSGHAAYAKNALGEQ